MLDSAPSAIADALLRAGGEAELAARIAAVPPTLALPVVAALKGHVDTLKLRNARRALAVAASALRLAAAASDPEAEALALWAEGNARYHLSEFAKAQSSYARAEAFYAGQGRTMEVLRLQINQVAALQDLGAFPEALAVADRARAACVGLGAPAEPFLALLEMNSGAALQQLGRGAEALACYERGRAIFVAQDDAVQAARIDINRANVLQELGRFAEAEALYRAAGAALAAADAVQELARAEHNIGKLAFRRGRYQEALRHLERARAGYAAIPNPLEVAKADLYRAFVYRDLGLLDEAAALAASSGTAFARARTRWEQALALGIEGSCRARLGDATAARTALARARRLLRSQGALARLPPLDLDRAALALAAGEPATARRLARTVAHAVAPDEWPALAARARTLLAHAQRAVGRTGSAVTLAREAAELAERYALPERAAAHAAVALAHEAAENRAAASRAHAAAVAAAEALRAGLPLDELRLAFLDTAQPIYQEALRFALLHQSAPVALAAADLALSAPMPRSSAYSADPATRAELRQLREAWAYLQSAAAEPSVAETAPLVATQRLHELELAIGELTRRLALQSDDGSALTPAQQLDPLDPAAAAARLAAIQGRLAPDEALLVYAPAGEALFALVVTATALEQVALPASVTAVERLLRAWRFQVEHVFSADATPATALVARAHLTRLYAALLAPLEQTLDGVAALSVALPPAWHDAPLAAALGPAGHLAKRMVLRLVGAPSALRVAPSALHPGPALVAGCSDDGRLPAAPREAAAVASALGPQRVVRLLTDGEATVSAIIEALPTCGLLHLAAHAVYRPDSPQFSWAQLADGPLAVADLAELRLEQQPLVVLSACESGRGQPRGGGLVGMARGFMLAGAAGLIASLWKVADGATAGFMADLYAQLQSHSPADALAAAQRRAIARGEHPFHWAAFVCIEA